MITSEIDSNFLLFILFCHGKFEIITIGGSFFPVKKESQCEVFEGLNVSLISDGNAFGGKLIDILIAASPVQVVLGSYPAGSNEEVKFDTKEPPKEDLSPPSAESQQKIESDPKEPKSLLGSFGIGLFWVRLDFLLTLS
ncbi:putative PPC domain-containing protein [Medicago truncatula]|nr:putative PPC domain-containing protein [Medicago truncatula]